jgi:aminoglycoside phosphotransferase (APT) family kinase protein
MVMRADADEEGRAGYPAGARVREHLLEVVGAGMPGVQVRGVELLGEGLDNLTFAVNGELVVRFSKEPEPVRRAELIRAETTLLAMVATISPLPVPEPVFTDPGRGCWAYAKIPGVPLLNLPLPQRLAHAPAAGAALGRFLAAVHAAPLAQMAQLAGPDEVPMTDWRDEAAENYATVRTMIPATRRGPAEAFVAAPPPDRGSTIVFCHNDLGIEHVLAVPGTGAITGVIDWGDAALADPARDFGLLYRDLGPAVLTAALASYRTDDPAAFRQRAVFYARCSLWEDLAYGAQAGRSAYTGKSLAALDWLFPA